MAFVQCLAILCGHNHMAHERNLNTRPASPHWVQLSQVPGDPGGGLEGPHGPGGRAGELTTAPAQALSPQLSFTPVGRDPCAPCRAESRVTQHLQSPSTGDVIIIIEK